MQHQHTFRGSSLHLLLWFIGSFLAAAAVLLALGLVVAYALYWMAGHPGAFYAAFTLLVIAGAVITDRVEGRATREEMLSQYALLLDDGQYLVGVMPHSLTEGEARCQLGQLRRTGQDDGASLGVVTYPRHLREAIASHGFDSQVWPDGYAAVSAIVAAGGVVYVDQVHHRA